MLRFVTLNFWAGCTLVYTCLKVTLGRMHTCVQGVCVHKCARCTLVYRGGCTQVCKVHTCVRFFGEDLPPPTSNLLTCGSAFNPNYTCMKSATVPHGTYGVFGSPCDVISGASIGRPSWKTHLGQHVPKLIM